MVDKYNTNNVQIIHCLAKAETGVMAVRKMKWNVMQGIMTNTTTV